MSVETKERLLDAAERLFADRGVVAASMRDLTAEAGVNLAAVNYHFGSKESLLAAVFARRLQPVNGQRLALLDVVEAEDGSPPLEDILWAYLAPPFRAMHQWGDAGRRFMRLVGRIMSDPGRANSETLVAQFSVVRARFLDAFGRALPELSGAELERRMHYVIGAMAHTFLWCETICCLDPGNQDDPDVVLHSLVRFAAAGLSAPAAPVVPAGPLVVEALP